MPCLIFKADKKCLFIDSRYKMEPVKVMEMNSFFLVPIIYLMFFPTFYRGGLEKVMEMKIQDLPKTAKI